MQARTQMLRRQPAPSLRFSIASAPILRRRPATTFASATIDDRFRQGQEGRTRSHGGLGIGLSLARKLVELHGGTIDARSDGKDKGATFVMRLPIRAVALPNDGKADAPAVSTAAASLSNLRVLIVDDEADARDLVREVLESSGADVLAADSAA